MAIIRDTHTKNFTVVSNAAVAQNRKLSFRARGLLLYLLSLPDDWVFNMHAVTANSSCEGRGAVTSARKELEKKGHLSIERLKMGRLICGTRWTVRESGKDAKASVDSGISKGGHGAEGPRENACADFEAFWQEYGQVGSRCMAKQAYEKAAAKIPPEELLLKAKLYRELCRGQGVYQKHAATWLANGCWADDPENERTSRQVRTAPVFMGHAEALEEVRRNCRL